VGLLAGALPEGVADPGFEALLSRIDESPFHPGHGADVFFSGEEAFASMLEAIAAASFEILLESYILRDDAPGGASRRPSPRPERAA
jgi:phosphatidylserine/phosphatidylglycerophosphate/cardiolipin synthase-like enzyme